MDQCQIRRISSLCVQLDTGNRALNLISGCILDIVDIWPYIQSDTGYLIKYPAENRIIGPRYPEGRITGQNQDVN